MNKGILVIFGGKIRTDNVSALQIGNPLHPTTLTSLNILVSYLFITSVRLEVE